MTNFFFSELINKRVFDSEHWSNIFSLDMDLNHKLEAYGEQGMKDFSFYSIIILYFLGTKTNMFGDILKTAQDFLENENALFIGTFISRINYISMRYRFEVNQC